jgi:hypothetical protein
MIVTVSARCERLSAPGFPRPLPRPPGPGSHPREPAPEPGPSRRLTSVHRHPATGFSELPLPVPATVFRAGRAGPAGWADDAPAGP